MGRFVGGGWCSAGLPPADPPCTYAARAVVDAAQWARSDNEARTIIAAAFQQRLVFGGQIHQVLDRMPVVRRRALVGRTAGDAREGSETITEIDLVGLCRAGGLPLPNRQVVRTDASGRKRYLDAFFDEWRVRVEIDGAHHMAVDQWWSDMRRHNDLRRALIAAGWQPRLSDLGR